MITGMTGFGSSNISTGRIKGVVEIKTVNHRYFDIAYYLPIGFGSLEEKIQRMVGKDIKRGRVVVSVKIIDKPSHSLYLNRDAVKQYLDFGKLLKKEYGLNNQLSVADVIRLPGVVDVKEVLVEANEFWPSIEQGLKKALAGVVVMRKREGSSLKADITDQLKLMISQVDLIKIRSRTLLQEKKKQSNHDEYLSFAKSNDINEEISRLTHYVQEAKASLKTGIAVGKKLDFIAQEMQRETNTIGSKVQDSEVSNAVITLKSKIEKIREQSQNVE